MCISSERLVVPGLLGVLTLSFAFVAWVGRGPVPLTIVSGEAPVGVLPDQAYQREGARIKVGGSGYVHIAQGVDAPFKTYRTGDVLSLTPHPAAAARLLSTPISLNWRHPLAGLPVAGVLRVAGGEEDTRTTERLHTVLFHDHGDMPVVSLVMPTGALVDPDTGLLVMGNAIFQAPSKVLVAEARDPKWWKYPGNFHMRGKAWERAGRMQYIHPDGTTGFEGPVRVRMNGQMTRGFPQHAFRLGFEMPLRFDLFGEEVGKGYKAVVLRAAGNDQIKAMLRDVFQHALCHGLPFETSRHRTCVVYVNGAYWGVHHLRPRMDEHEIARRYGIKKKHITILEDEARLYFGDTAQVVHFERLATRTARWDGHDAAWADSLEARVDIEGFLTYMATQMILGNMDWPNQNVRFWRYSGTPRPERPLDGRWYFIMGDSDLGYGAQGSPQADMFMRARAMDVPVTRLFWGMMNAPGLKDRFISIAQGLVDGPFAAGHALDELEHIEALMAPEMERHTARWRKPANVSVWVGHLEVMRTFARERGAAVREQLRSFAGHQ